MNSGLLGKCGFYCGACPTYISGNCSGCMDAHTEGDCFSRDCVLSKGLDFCGRCGQFPCEELLHKPHSTVLDKEWLLWKKVSDANL